MKEKRVLNENYAEAIFVSVVAFGIILRFLIMEKGWNYDFDSYKIVGELVSNGENVYASTGRYNYGPLFSIILGICYWIGLKLESETLFRMLVISVLILADLGITIYLRYASGVTAAVLFMLSPVSIIITGYHNQFDNIAIFLMLIAGQFYMKKTRLGEIGFIVFFSLSITMKHIFAFFILWILASKGIELKRKILYSVVPSILFLLSFTPYILNNVDALQGIIKHVFLYRSYNNAPLYSWICRLMNIPSSWYMVIFLTLMFLSGVIFRLEDFDRKILLYTICMIAFSSAIANQYLVIPLAAMFFFDKKIAVIYNLFIGYYLCCEGAGLNIANWILDPLLYNVPILGSVLLAIYKYGYFIACVICFALFIKVAKKDFPNINIKELVRSKVAKKGGK